MKTKILRRSLASTCTLLASLSLLTSCKDNSAAESSETPPASGENQALASLFVDAAPAGALQVSQALQDPTPGKNITVSGEVMGKMNSLPEGIAMVVLGDPTKLTPCNRRPGDACETPWDVCCDDPDVITQSIATVQILGEDGRPLKTGLKGQHGIKELSFLTVTGTIAEGSNEKNLLVNASGIHVAEVSPYADAPPVGTEGAATDSTGADKPEQ